MLPVIHLLLEKEKGMKEVESKLDIPEAVKEEACKKMHVLTCMLAYVGMIEKAEYTDMLHDSAVDNIFEGMFTLGMLEDDANDVVDALQQYAAHETGIDEEYAHGLVLAMRMVMFFPVGDTGGAER